MTGVAVTTELKRLIINADDFGYSPSVNRGIVEAHRAGVLTSTSMMVNAPGWADAVHLAPGVPELGIGLHLNLVVGPPVARVPTLTNPRTGELYPFGVLARRALAGLVDPEDVARETAAQLDCLVGTGIPITHLDSHRHAHALPGIWGPVVATANVLGVRVVRTPRESLRRNPQDVIATFKKVALRAAHRVSRWRVPAVVGPDHFVGISLQGGTRFLPRLLHLLDRLPPGTTELMVHVGYAEDVLPGNDQYRWQRVRELEALTSSPVRARLHRGDIELVHFGML